MYRDAYYFFLFSRWSPKLKFFFSDVGCNRDYSAVRSVHRKVLLETLAEELPPDTIRFSSKLISIESETLEDSSKAALLHLEDGTVMKAKVPENNQLLLASRNTFN
jgi:hypothetical protein